MLYPYANQESQPRVVRPRRYGPADGSRFDHFCLGNKSIGKVKIDCTFLFKKSEWGLVGDSPGTPGGVVFLDLNFDQPPDCKIKHATVSVTVDDQYDQESFDKFRTDPRETTSRNAEQRYRRETATSPVHITAYGPRCITGEQKTKMVKKSVNFTPYIEAMGNGVGGMGIDNHETQLYACRWWLKGSRQADASQVYKTVQWQLTENDLDSQPMHSNVFKTAFAFAHYRQPVVLSVKIEAKLDRTTDRMRNRFDRLKLSSLRSDGTSKTAGTMIVFGRDMRWRRSLHDLEGNLEQIMEMENYQAIPASISDPLPVDFKPVPTLPTQPSLATAPSSNILAATAPRIDIPPAVPDAPARPSNMHPQLLRHEADVLELSDDGQSVFWPGAIEPTPTNLARFANAALEIANDVSESMAASNKRSSRRETQQCDDLSDGSTLVGGPSESGSDDQETIRQAMEIPMILTFVRFFVWTMALFGLKPIVETKQKSLAQTSV